MSFMEIFQPGLKYLREERERQRMNVAYPTDGADPLMEIDLDAGTATIVITTRGRVARDGLAPASPTPESRPPDDPAGAADLAMVGQPGRRRTSAWKPNRPAGQPSAD